MQKEVIIIGASGHGKVVADVIIQSGDRVIGFLDDNPELPGRFIGFPVLGKVECFKEYQEYYFIIAIGNASIREKIALKMDGVQWYTAIHPSAVISNMGVKIGEGSVIMANAVINADAAVGRHCIINSGAVVEHDDQIGDFVHVSVGAHIAGTVHIGKKTWIGIGASVSNNLSVCSECLVGAGAVVVTNIMEPGTYIGVPAERKEMSNKENMKIIGGGGNRPPN